MCRAQRYGARRIEWMAEPATTSANWRPRPARSALRISRLAFETAIIERYNRRQPSVEEALVEMRVTLASARDGAMPRSQHPPCRRLVPIDPLPFLASCSAIVDSIIRLRKDPGRNRADRDIVRAEPICEVPRVRGLDLPAGVP
jgi:hypothetical protein